MNGNKRFLLDTNAIIALLQGHTSLLHQLNNAEWVGISIISQLEFLVFPKLTAADVAHFEAFIKQVDVIGLSQYQTSLLHTIITIRQKQGLKLPDAIILGTAIENQATLITADKQLQNFDNVIPLN